MTTLLRDLGRLVLSGLVSLPLLIGPVAQAAPITFDLLWDGSSFGNTASAFGSITLDRTTLPESGTSLGTLADFGVTALSITVSNASTGNGTFGITAFTRLIWAVNGPLDFDMDLVGQPNFRYFAPFSAPITGAPSGFRESVIFTGGSLIDTDYLDLTSVSVATPETPVPVPATLALFGLGGLLLAARRFRPASGRPDAPVSR